MIGGSETYQDLLPADEGRERVQSYHRGESQVVL